METGICPDNFEKTMCQCLMDYQPMIDRWLHVRFPKIYSEAVVFDCHSQAMLNILEKGFTGMSAEEMQHEVFGTALRHVSTVYKHAAIPKHLAEGYYVKEDVDFKKLDADFINYLTLYQRKIWSLRREGKKLKEIAALLNRSVNCIAVNCYDLRKAYCAWVKMTRTFVPGWIELLPSFGITRKIAELRFIKGMSLACIAEEMGITRNNTYQILWRIRAVFRKQGIDL